MTDQKKEEIVKEDQRPRCKKCGSTFAYIRIKDQQRICRSCGFVEDLNKEENKK